MKKIISLILVLVLALGCVFSLASCEKFIDSLREIVSAAKPSEDYKEARSFLKDADYNVEVYDAEDFEAIFGYYFEGLEHVVMAYNDDATEGIYIFYFEDEAAFADAEGDLDEFLGEMTESAEDEDIEMIIGKSGAMAWIGTEKAIKIASGAKVESDSDGDDDDIDDGKDDDEIDDGNQDDDDKKDDDGEGPSVNADAGRDEFIDSIGGTSDTYTGSVSEETYGSKDEAALAYVNNEIVGLYNEASIESVESKGELSESEIEALNLPEEIKGDVDSVEKLEVTYSELEGYSALSASSSSTKTAIVYIVKIGPDYRYFTPCPTNGDTITKSYYDSVFNEEKYANCTYVNESYVEIIQTVSGQTVTYEATMVQEIKRDNGKAFFKQTITGDYELIAQLGGDAYLECYMEKDDEGNVQTWVRNSADGYWSQGYLTQNIDPFAGQSDLDYSYFSKADFGFALKGENAIKFYKGHTNSQIPEDAELALYAEYYVNEGVLSGMRMEYSCDMTVTQYGYKIHSITNGLNKMSCVDYGSTVVERPAVD